MWRKKMKIKLNSGLFSVTPPCCYHVFQGYLYDIEERETEDLKEYAEELITNPDMQFMLFEEKMEEVRRCDLPLDSPEYACPKEVTLDWDKAKEVISKSWLYTFEYWIRQKGLKAKLEFLSVDSPREYNFRGDECDFHLTISKACMNRVIDKCFDDREGFEKYLKEFHSSYDGFWSYISNNIDDHMEAWSLFRGNADIEQKNIKHLFWVALDYYLFNDIRDEFDTALWDNVYDACGNGEFYRAMEYKPIELEVAV
jgi:hypothetical protein